MKKVVIPGLLIMLLASLAVSSAVACSPGSTWLTHMGQLASNHVTLGSTRVGTGGCEPCQLDFSRVLPDGSLEAGVFRVPEGKVLVVTDVDWKYRTHGLFETNRVQSLRLFVENLAGYPPSVAFESTITLVDDGYGGLAGGISEHMTSGFVVSSGTRVCPDVYPGPACHPEGGGLQHLILRGYLIEDR